MSQELKEHQEQNMVFYMYKLFPDLLIETTHYEREIQLLVYASMIIDVRNSWIECSVPVFL